MVVSLSRVMRQKFIAVGLLCSMVLSFANAQEQANENWNSETREAWLDVVNKYYNQIVGDKSKVPAGGDSSFYWNRDKDFCQQFPSLCPYKFFIGPMSFIHNSVSGWNNVLVPSWRFVTHFDVHLAMFDNKKLSKITDPAELAIIKAYNAATFTNGKFYDVQAIGRIGLEARIQELCQKGGVTCSKKEIDRILLNNCGWKETRKKQAYNEVVQVRSKTRVISDIDPMIYANVDFSEKISSLSVFNPEAFSGSPLLVSDLVQLQPSKKEDGYRVSKTRAFGLGAGPSFNSVVRWSGNPILSVLGRVGGYVGVMGVISLTDTVNRRVKSLEDDDKNHIYRQRTGDYEANKTIDHVFSNVVNQWNGVKSTDDVVDNIIDHWSVDDSYSFQYSGGVVFSTGLSWMAIASGPTYFYERANDVKMVTKVGPKKVMVEVRDIKINSLAITATLGIATASAIPINDVENLKTTYVFDFEYPVAREAFKKLMSGVYYDAQLIAGKGDTPAVARIENERSKMYLTENDSMRSFFFGIPFIFSSKLRGDESQDGVTKYYVDGKKLEINQGININRSDRRIIFDHKMELKGFYGGVQRVSDLGTEGNVTHNYYGRYVWNYQDESASKGNFVEQLGKLTHLDTGLEELNFGTDLLKKKLGYVNIELTLDISQQASEVLYRKVLDQEADFLEKAVRSEVDKYFAAYGDGRNGPPSGIYEADYCSVYGDFSPNGAKEDIAREDWSESMKRCKKAAEKQTFESGVIGKMLEQLQQIRKISSAVNNREERVNLSHAYREFGKTMMTNRFTFKAIYNLLKDANLGDFVTLKIQGQEIASTVRFLPSGLYETKPDISMR